MKRAITGIATSQHSIGRRSSEYAVVVPRVQGPGSSTFAFTAAKLWIALPANIQIIDTPDSFRRGVYMFIVRNYEAYGTNTFLYSFDLFIVLLYVFVLYLLYYCILYIGLRTILLDCICKTMWLVCILTVFAILWCIGPIYIHDLHSIFFDWNLSRNNVSEDHIEKGRPTDVEEPLEISILIISCAILGRL